MILQHGLSMISLVVRLRVLAESAKETAMITISALETWCVEKARAVVDLDFRKMLTAVKKVDVY